MQYRLTGPIIWFVNLIGVLSAVLALFVSVDVWRPVRSERLPDTRAKLLWGAPQMLYLVLVAAEVVPGVMPDQYRWVAIVFAPIALGFQVAYLLRVVYPKPEEESAGG